MQIEFTTRGLLSNFFRQRWKLIFLFLAAVLSGVIYISVAKPVYEASGSLLVKFGHDISSQITHTEDGSPLMSQDDRREVMQSNVDILQSHNLLWSVINEIGPEKIYPGITRSVAGSDLPVEAALKKLEKSDLAIRSSQTSNVIDIKMQNEDPQVAAWFIHRLMEVFIARQSEIFNKPQTDFLQDQVKQAAAKLEESQKALEAFKSERGISSIEEEQADLLRQKTDTGTLSLDSMDTAWDRLSDLQAEEKRLSTVYLPNSPQVVRAHEETQLAQKQLHEREGELKARTSKTTAKIDRRIGELEAERKQYDDLARQVDIDEKNYKNYQLRNEEARVNETLNQKNISSVVVIDEPIVPMKPAQPHKTLVITLCVLFGLVMSTAVAMAFETFDQRFSSPEQVAMTLGLPVMACFNHDRKGIA